MRLLKKFFIIFMLVMIVILGMNSKVLAATWFNNITNRIQDIGNTVNEGINHIETTGPSIDATIQGAQDFIDSADTTGTIDEAAVQRNVGFIYNIFFACGMVIAVVCGVCLGIKFMVSSTEGKAEVKELLLPYIIGCVIIFGAFGIWKIVITVMEAFN